MKRLDFSHFPVSTLFGSRWKNFRELTHGRTIDKGYKGKFVLTGILCRLMSVTHPVENWQYKKKLNNTEIEQPPVFILGHWRSGTTFVHNVLAKDKQFGYNTTYQTVFSNTMVWGQPLFKRVMGAVMPEKRPGDNLELEVDQPQEEELAFTNIMPVNFYNFWFFPRNTLEYCEKYLLFNDISDEEKSRFKTEFDRLIKTALFNTGGKRFLSKNPPHTGRVKDLLKMYPDAKFIYLVRNPYTVFESTRNFFSNTLNALTFQDISEQEIESNILEVYKRMYDTYEEDKKLIPEGDLIEMKFEDFEGNGVEMTKAIYNQLNIDGLDQALPEIENYFEEKKGYKKSAYSYSSETRQTVNANWGFAIDQWGYDKLDDN